MKWLHIAIYLSTEKIEQKGRQIILHEVLEYLPQCWIHPWGMLPWSCWGVVKLPHLSVLHFAIIQHTLRGEHMNVSFLYCMCRSLTQCVADPIWGVCHCSYTLSNITVAALQYATTKKLHPEQQDEAEAFLLVSCYFIAFFTLKSSQESAVGHQARLYITILLIENKIDTFWLAVPPYQVSEELKVCNHWFNITLPLRQSSQTNINNYGLAVLLSINISAYKGNIPSNMFLFVLPCCRSRFLLTSIQDILKWFWFNLLVGIKHDYAIWEKVTTAISYSLTQTCSRLKNS